MRSITLCSVGLLCFIVQARLLFAYDVPFPACVCVSGLSIFGTALAWWGLEASEEKKS